ncbi:cation-transporting P-type ATPase [Chloroflexota bacterium]
MSNTSRWYQLPPEDALKALGDGEEGLGSAEARNRLAQYGPNEVEFNGRSPLLRFLQRSNSPLIYVLLDLPGKFLVELEEVVAARFRKILKKVII